MSDLSPTFDRDGYPTLDTEETIENWTHEAGFHELMGYVMAAWHYPDWAKREGDTYKFATGGWSGNESLITSLESNCLFWQLCWYLSQRGGYHEFKVPEIRKGKDGHTPALPPTAGDGEQG